MRIEADRERCASSGMCVLTAPDVFDQDEDDGRVVLLMPDVTEEQEAAVRKAIQLCPSRALSLS